MFDFFIGLGLIGILILICLLIVLPLFVTVVVGVALANIIGLTGLGWWCFVVLFYIVVTSIIGAGTR